MSFAPRWFRRQSPALPFAAPRVPEDQRVYAIGDIHGRADLLGDMRELIAADLDRFPIAEARTVLLGDYVDRGPDSKGVIELLTSGQFPTPVIPLKGNHEAMLLGFLEAPETGEFWRRNGGMETLYSYSVDLAALRTGRGFAEAAARFRELLPAAHLEFLQRLPCRFSSGDYFFCHAGVRPGVALDRQREEDLIWIRGEFLASDEFFGKVVVHGHNATPEPQIKTNQINVDTGAYISNRLTCLVLEGGQQRFLQAAPARGPEARR